MATGRIHVGVGGWSYAPWRGVFYPEDLPTKGELGYEPAIDFREGLRLTFEAYAESREENAPAGGVR